MKILPRYLSTRVKTTISALKAAKESLLESLKNILDPHPLRIKLFSLPMHVSNNSSRNNKICTARPKTHRSDSGKMFFDKDALPTCICISASVLGSYAGDHKPLTPIVEPIYGLYSYRCVRNPSYRGHEKLK
jgi:hypothetical protein